MSTPEFETRVYIRPQCFLSRTSDKPKTEFLGALAAIFVPLLLEKALGGIAGAMKKAGADETLRESGRLPTYLYRLTRNGKTGADAKNVLGLNPEFGCLLIVRGAFSSTSDIPPATTKYGNALFLDDSDQSESQRTKLLNDNGIPVTEIAVLYEAEVTISEDKTALRYTSRFLEVNNFQGDKSHDKRAMAINIVFTGAGQKEGEPVLSLAMLDFGQVEKGSVIGPDKLSGKRSGWLGGLGISDASFKAIETLDFPPEPKPGDDRKFLPIMPVTIEGLIAETDEGNKVWKFLGEILDSTKGDVSKAVSGEILKDREKEKTEAANALEKLRQDEEAAYGAFLDAKTTLAKLNNPSAEELAAARFKVEAAQRAWCLKFNTVKTMGISLTRADSCP